MVGLGFPEIDSENSFPCEFENQVKLYAETLLLVFSGKRLYVNNMKHFLLQKKFYLRLWLGFGLDLGCRYGFCAGKSFSTHNQIKQLRQNEIHNISSMHRTTNLAGPNIYTKKVFEVKPLTICNVRPLRLPI